MLDSKMIIFAIALLAFIALHFSELYDIKIVKFRLELLFNDPGFFSMNPEPWSVHKLGQISNTDFYN